MERALVKYSESPSGIDTSTRLTFSSKRFKNGTLSNSNHTFRTINDNPGYAYGSRPLNEGEWFHIKLNKVNKNSNWINLFHFGFTDDSEEIPQWYVNSDITIDWSATVSPTRYVYREWGRIKLVSMVQPKIGDIFSVRRTEYNGLPYGYNGVDQDCRSSFGCHFDAYPYVYLYGASEVQLLS